MRKQIFPIIILLSLLFAGCDKNTEFSFSWMEDEPMVSLHYSVRRTNMAEGG